MASSNIFQPTSTGFENEEVCLATPDDKEAVLNIDPNFHGLDYLSDCYSTYTQGPGASGYVLKKEGEVVGFFSCQVVDGGQTLVTAAGRLLEAHRGGGFYGRAQKIVFETFRGSAVRKIAMVLNNVNMETFGGKLLQQYKVVHDREGACHTADLEALQGRDLSETMTDISSIHQLPSEKEFQLLMSTAGNRLFPDDRMMVELKPFRIMEENVRTIFNGGTHERVMIVSSGASDLSVEDPDRFSSSELVFSCGSYYYNLDVVHYIADIYATQNAGKSKELLKHLEWHMKHMVDVIKPVKACFHWFFSSRLTSEMDMLSKMYPTKAANVPFSSMHVVEMDFV